MTELLIDFCPDQKKTTKYRTLNSTSPLYDFIADSVARLKHSGMRLRPSTFEPCVQLVFPEEEKGKSKADLEALVEKRVQLLKGKRIDIEDREIYKSAGRQFEMRLPTIDGIVPKVIIATLNTLAPHRDRFLNVMLREDYSMDADWDNDSASDI